MRLVIFSQDGFQLTSGSVSVMLERRGEESDAGFNMC